LKLSVGQKIFFGYGLAMVFMAMTGIAGYWGTGRLLDANYWVRHTFEVIVEAENVRADLLEFEGDTRGYVANGDERFLESLAAEKTRLDQSQRRLRWLTVDNASQQLRLDTLEPLIGRRLEDLSHVSLLRKQDGLAAAVAFAEQSGGRQRTAEIHELLTVVENEERSLLAVRDRASKQDAQAANRIILFGDLLGFVLAALIGVATHRSITRPLSEFERFVTAVGEGDLTQKCAREGGDELGMLGRGLNQMVTRLRGMASQTRAATENLNSTTMQILASAKQQSALTGEQLAAYQQTNATMQEVSQSCTQITEKAKQVTAVAEAVSIANTSSVDAVQKANQTVEAIHEQAEAVAQNIVSLSEKTQAVGDILATVNDIAEQSHLLALNAAIEAAAAGEHGRTFSVVAGEIKNLADQSKAATVQVKSILGDIQKEIHTSVMLTEEAVKRVDIGRHQADAAASSIRTMSANIDQSVQAFQQIVAGTNQQQIGFENVMQALKDISRASEQAASGTRQTEKAAANLNDIGTQLRLATEGYRL
jgi:methyl-accepting chemotaxis protein